MTTIPENTITAADLTEWYRLQEELKKIKAAEMLLRLKIYKGYFTAPAEGTNTVPLANGWVIKGKRTIQRDVDIAALQVNCQVDEATKMTRLSSMGIHVESLIKWKPELVTKTYRLLTEEQMTVFNECLVIKEGSPALEIVLPAAAAKAAAVAAPTGEQDPANQ